MRAALLWAGDGAVLSHGSAAFIHQLDGASAPNVPELYAPTGKAVKGIKAHRSSLATRLSTVRVQGLAVTRVERTLADLSSRWPPATVGRTMDDALRRGLTSLDRLADERAAMKVQRRSGARVFNRLIAGRDHRDMRVRSRFESLVLKMLDDIAPSVPDHHVLVDGRSHYLDFAYPDLMLAIECQSIRWHLGEEAFKADMARHRRLSSAGWMVLFVCWDDVIFERARLKDEILEALRRRKAFMQPELLSSR